MHPHICASIYHICTSTLSLLHICPVFLSFLFSTYLFSRLCAFTSSHAHIDRSTSPPPYIYRSISHLHIHTDCHSFTSTFSFSLSMHLFDSAGQLHVSLSGQPSSSLSLLRAHLHIRPSLNSFCFPSGRRVCVCVSPLESQGCFWSVLLF